MSDNQYKDNCKSLAGIRAAEKKWPNEHVREVCANSSDTPTEMLTKLSRDKNLLVRGKVALNPSTPAKIVQRLASDEDRFVRTMAAGNEKLSRKKLQCMAGDPDEYVRKEAGRTLKKK